MQPDSTWDCLSTKEAESKPIRIRFGWVVALFNWIKIYDEAAVTMGALFSFRHFHLTQARARGPFATRKNINRENLRVYCLFILWYCAGFQFLYSAFGGKSEQDCSYCRSFNDAKMVIFLRCDGLLAEIYTDTHYLPTSNNNNNNSSISILFASFAMRWFDTASNWRRYQSNMILVLCVCGILLLLLPSSSVAAARWRCLFYTLPHSSHSATQVGSCAARNMIAKWINGIYIG